MSNLKILVVEDKRMVAEDIKESLEEMNYQVVDIVNSGEKAIQSYKANSPELLLMDIFLKGQMDGIDTAREIYKISPVPLIYLTAYSDKATVKRALQTHPSSYLTKPFDNRELEIAIELAIANFVDQKYHDELVSRQDYITDKMLFLKTGNVVKKIPLDKILYAKANGSYTDLITSDNHFTLSFNLQHFLKRAIKLSLIRVHRSYAVNLNKLKGFRNNKLIVGDIEIPVSRTYKTSVKELIDKL